VTGYEDDDIGGYEPRGRRVRTTPGQHWKRSDSGSDRNGQHRYGWRDEPQGNDLGLGDDLQTDDLETQPDPTWFDGGPDDGYPDEAHAEVDQWQGEPLDPEPFPLEALEADDFGELESGDGTLIADDGGPSDVTPVGTPTPEGAPEARRRRRAAKAESRHRRILSTFALIVVVFLIVCAIGVVYARRAINPGGGLGPAVTVKIPANTSTSGIGKILAADGVIHQPRLFPLYTKLTNAGVLLPGTYRLAKNESYSRVVHILENGPPLVVEKLTIPEGFTLAQIAARVAALPKLHLSAAKFLAAASTGRVRSEFEPAGVNNLEGLVFPATYEITQGQEETDILQEMVNTFDERMTALGLVAAAAKEHYSPYQVLTVASIIEREAKLEVDRPFVSSVIFNRLARKMPLGADSTQTYYLRLTHPNLEPTVAELDAPSAYNTRLNVGLPPTPIANPGIPSIEAAMKPVYSTYLYFVEINPDGKLGYAVDSTGFVKLQAQCRSAHLC
jgi:peptidoglycan lytic transglycosylase G